MHIPDTLRNREAATFAMAVALAVLFDWDARDLIWGAWISAFATSFALLASAVLRWRWPQTPGEEPVPLSIGIPFALVLAIFILLPLLQVGVMLLNFHPEHERVTGLAFLPAVREGLGYAIGEFWPLAMATALPAAVSFHLRPASRHEKGKRLMQQGVEIFRFFPLGIFLFVLIELDWPRFTAFVALAVLMVPNESISRRMQRNQGIKPANG